jgi:type I restriction enzyme S subunit
MATTQDFANWVCGPRLLPDYLLWAFRAMKPDFARTMMGSTHQTIYMPDIRRLAIPVPPLPEQRAIADFLDRKTATIDALIERKQQGLKVLEERRLATIAQAVSKGVSAAAQMKPSGHDWLGSAPAHWRVKRIKYVARLESGHTPDRSQADYWLDSNNIPWVSLNDTKWLSENDYISDTALHVNELGLANSSAHMLPARVVVFTRDATIGKAAITPMAVSQHIIAWVCGPMLHPEYLLYVFYAMEQELIRCTMGATLRTIGMADVKQLVTPVPPLGEQKAIAEFLAMATAQIAATRTNIERQVEHLREYRQAMITAAVTGQADVAVQEAA